MQRMCRNLGFGLLALILGVSFSVCTLHAQSNGLSKLTVHGYLTQAYATADFAEGLNDSPHTDELNLGISEDGTFDYRTMAIQFRYEISPKDTMIFQFSSRALGDSPIELVEDEIELDWAFYERRIGDNTSVKVGRVQIPIGIYNEVRDVGTLLPFYRPAFIFYRDGSFTSETVDGLVLSHSFLSESDWGLDFDLYIGEWTVIEQTAIVGDIPSITRASDAIGSHVWLNTPVSGLRFGVGFHREDLSGGDPIRRALGEKPGSDSITLSAELVRDKFALRAETWTQDFDASSTFPSTSIDASYVQASYNATEKFRINLQYEFGDVHIPRDSLPLLTILPSTGDADFDFREDFGVSVNYLFSPNLVLKLEHHITDFEELAFAPVFDGPGPPVALRPAPNPATGKGSYTILSLSASF